MKPETKLDSVVFQLTPTRTRCDLVITAKGKTEKVASGLLDPFLAHLKAAQDQIAKGGYSITIQPDPQTDATWFTKATVERFVRFVNTPVILERVNTIESEILQIQEAIVIQGKETLRGGNDEDHQVPPVNHTGVRSTTHLLGSKTLDVDSDKAIVIYKPSVTSPETNGSVVPEESSKVHLLSVLQTRKSVLQKEQGMAFARAVAAGFDMDQMPSLISFAECFGAARLLTACTKFVALWRQKHESGQWVEIEAAEAMSMRPDLFSVNASGIMLSSDDTKQNADKEAWPGSTADRHTDSSGKTCDGTDASNNPQKSSLEYAQGQFQFPMFPQWPAHAHPGAPGFQPYPIPGMPYYGPFYPPPYSQVEDHRVNSHRRRKAKGHSVNSEESDAESEVEEEDDTRSSEGRSMKEQDIASQGSHRKPGRMSKKQTGVVVIRNINYIASKGQNALENESESASQRGSDEESTDLQSKHLEKQHKKSSQHSKDTLEHTQSVGDPQTPDKEDDSGNWEVFQSFLLRNEESSHADGNRSMFSGEKVHALRKKQRNTAADPLFPPDHNFYDAPERNMLELDRINGRKLQRKHSNANYELNSTSDGRNIQGSSSNVKLQEMEGGSGYMRGSSDDFIMWKAEKHLNVNGSLDFCVENERRLTGGSEIGSQGQTNDEFIVPCRSTSEQFRRNPNAVDMESELPSIQERRYSDAKVKKQGSYEPHDLSLMPKRDREREPTSYDPAIHYDIEEHFSNNVSSGKKIEDKEIKLKQGLKKTDKNKSSKSSQSPWEKRKMDLLRKGKPSKSNPLAEAQARAEKLRAFKADLLKTKKEKEEEEMKRLEALKRERQKRIAARSAQSSSTLLASRTQASSKSPLNMGSKFRDSSPAFSSPLQRFPVRRISTGSIDAKNITKSSTLSAKKSAGNELIKSASSVPELKKESNGVPNDRKEVRRLSEPKASASRRSSSVTSLRDLQMSKRSSLGSNDALQISKRSSLGSNEGRQSASVKLKGNVHGPKKIISDGSQSSKISAIMNLDKSKSATLPELRTKLACNFETMPLKLSGKEIISIQSEAKVPTQKGRKIADSSTDLTDDSLIIEKSVVTLEKDIFPGPGKTVEAVLKNDDSNSKIDAGNALSKYPLVHAPPSPVTFDDVMKDNNETKIHQKNISCEVKNMNPGKSIFIPSEKPYRAPYARATSMEDIKTSNVNHIHDLHVKSSEAPETSLHVSPTHVSNSNPNSGADTPEMLEKSGKESSKGLIRLLKFGRKSHNPTSSEGSIDPEGASLNNDTVATEATTLKTLISEDDSPSGGNHPKSSRSFSIFSPFRSKSNEKKLSA